MCILLFLHRKSYHAREYKKRGRDRDERKIASPTQPSNTALAQPSQILGPTSTRLETFPDEQKLMEFFTTRPAPQDRLKEVLPVDSKGG